MSHIVNYLDKYPVILQEINNSSTNVLNLPVFVINLDSDKYRRGYIKFVMKRMNLNYTLVIVKQISEQVAKQITSVRKSVAGCCLSHLWCIRNAILKSHSHFLILEDDIVFHKNFLNLIKRVNYKNYDMVQLGGCDFNLRSNLGKNTNKNDFRIYHPTKNALGAYGNIYNIGFAKMLLNQKITNFNEFDVNMHIFYKKYQIGVCYPNLITSELSTSNLGHKFSVFDAKNKRYTNNCHINFDYGDYDFIWVIFLEYCFEQYTANNNILNDYEILVSKFTEKIGKCNEEINKVLLSNNYTHDDILEIMKIYSSDKIRTK